jgi:hypothetical protein
MEPLIEKTFCEKGSVLKIRTSTSENWVRVAFGIPSMTAMWENRMKNSAVKPTAFVV